MTDEELVGETVRYLYDYLLYMTNDEFYIHRRTGALPHYRLCHCSYIINDTWLHIFH
jgi:hypothetical protein